MTSSLQSLTFQSAETIVPNSMIEPYSKIKWNPTIYEKKADIQQEIAYDLLSSHIFSGNERRILDIGCGDGSITAFIEKKTNTEVVGIDSSPEMISFANKYSNKKLKFLEKDITDCSLVGAIGRFDMIFSFNALHWVQDQEMALRNLYNMLEDHGTLKIQLFSPLTTQKLLHGNINQLISQDKWIGCFCDFTLPLQMTIPTVSDYELLLKKIGFNAIECKAVKYEFTRKKQEIIEGFKSWIPYLSAIPEPQKQEEFLTELVDMILKETAQSSLESPKIFLFPWVIQAKK
jgi:trans-aconitate methyltransferase